MKLTRRQLAAMAAPAVLRPSVARGQTGTRPDDEELQAARERLRSNANAMADTSVPMATEPAFEFKA
jgi:hypothetical protein